MTLVGAVLLTTGGSAGLQPRERQTHPAHRGTAGWRVFPSGTSRRHHCPLRRGSPGRWPCATEIHHAPRRGRRTRRNQEAEARMRRLACRRPRACVAPARACAAEGRRARSAPAIEGRHRDPAYLSLEHIGGAGRQALRGRNSDPLPDGLAAWQMPARARRGAHAARARVGQRRECQLGNGAQHRGGLDWRCGREQGHAAPGELAAQHGADLRAAVGPGRWALAHWARAALRWPASSQASPAARPDLSASDNPAR